MLKMMKKLFNSKEKSKETAKKRLQLVLIHDRTDISPEIMNELREEMIKVISKYLSIDISNIELELDKNEGSTALVANIPIVGSKRKSRQG